MGLMAKLSRSQNQSQAEQEQFGRQMIWQPKVPRSFLRTPRSQHTKKAVLPCFLLLLWKHTKQQNCKNCIPSWSSFGLNAECYGPCHLLSRTKTPSSVLKEGNETAEWGGVSPFNHCLQVSAGQRAKCFFGHQPVFQTRSHSFITARHAEQSCQVFSKSTRQTRTESAPNTTITTKAKEGWQRQASSYRASLYCIFFSNWSLVTTLHPERLWAPFSQ